MTKARFEKGDEKAFRQAADAAAQYRAALIDAPIRPDRTFADKLADFAEDLPAGGTSSDAVIAELADKSVDGLADSCNPRFFGYVIGGGHPAGVAADMLVAAWNQNSPMTEFTPTVTALEEVARRWLLELLDLPRDASMGICTGGTTANTTALTVARTEMLRRAGWDAEEDGLFGAPAVHVAVGAECHSAIQAGLRQIGFGASRVHTVPADEEGRMRPDALADIVAGLPDGPTIIVAQAGNINSGGIDPIGAIADVAESRGAWLHVDGAFGLWANVHPELRPQIEGVERADSWVVDGHKWLQVPYDCGIVLVRDMAAHARAMGHSAAYLPNSVSAADPVDFVPELSRRARGVAVWATLKAFGAEGVRDLIIRNCRLARRMAGRLAAEPGVNILNRVDLNQVAVAFGPAGETGDQLTAAVLARVQAEGICYPSHGVWHGRKTLRLSLSGYLTTEEDADKSVDAIIAAWRVLKNEAA